MIECKKIVFMGTPVFAREMLRALIEAKKNVTLAVTRSDKPKGRGKQTLMCETKAFAIENGIEVITPDTLKDEAVVERIRSEEPDLIVVAAYGKILPESVLNIAKYGCINVHASLLPRYRGAAPINRAIENGETEGGVTIMRMEKGLDTGDMLHVKKMAIPDTMNAGEYHDALCLLGGEALVEYIGQLENGTATSTKQCDGDATYAQKIDKSELLIPFEKTNVECHNFVRAMAPRPAAYCMIDGVRTLITRTEVRDNSGTPGTILSATKAGIEVACGKGSLLITALRPEGKREMTVAEYIVGHKPSQLCGR